MKDIVIEGLSYLPPDVLDDVMGEVCSEQGTNPKIRLDDSKLSSPVFPVTLAE